ncbi:uncharacterized protein TNCV_3052701 [Trichonephila clavipes]|nr:uncharacterized protein TNCV_3052701 [Trichonephila clavipes]
MCLIVSKKLTNPSEWRHISGSLNPADLPSIGCNIENLSRSRWWEGPKWLKLPSTDWPQSDINPDLETINSLKKGKQSFLPPVEKNQHHQSLMDIPLENFLLFQIQCRPPKTDHQDPLVRRSRYGRILKPTKT